MPEGKLIKYDPAGYGFIGPDGGGDDIYVHINDVEPAGTRYLVEGERLEYVTASGDRGPLAKKVKRFRQKGTVKSYKTEQGYGFIAPDDGSDDRFFHCRDIAGDEHPEPEEGARVEFSPWKTEKGLCAVGVVIGDEAPDDRRPLEKFADLYDFDEHLRKLAELAEPEPWDYRESPTDDFPVLYSYIQNTFERIQEERKVAEVIDGSKNTRYACFNTGLVTPLQEEIFAVFVENRSGPSGREQFWRLIGFFPESAHQLRQFAEKPAMAEFITDPADLVYDWRLGAPRVSAHHIINMRKDRFPKDLQENRYRMKGAFDAAVGNALNRIRRNYKTAVPQFYEGQVELLLPLCLLAPQRADLALPVRRIQTEEGEYYIANTVLPLDWAYRNARLLAKPDSDWLAP